MDIKALFPNMSLIWTRWSSYEIVHRMDMGVEKEYIVPAPGAEQIVYDCTERTETLVEDAILIGEAVVKKNLPAALIDTLCEAFAARFGLLGQMVGTKSSPMEGRNSMAPIYYPVNSRMYGEELSYIKDCFEKIFRHFAMASGIILDMATLQSDFSQFGLNGALNYRVTVGPRTQIIWGVDCLEDVLRLAYSLMVTSEKPPLRVCKNCQKVYYNTHTKSEFCGAKCRNQYNVKLYRIREEIRNSKKKQNPIEE